VWRILKECHTSASRLERRARFSVIARPLYTICSQARSECRQAVAGGEGGGGRAGRVGFLIG
jgi:hypothetical protein